VKQQQQAQYVMSVYPTKSSNGGYGPQPAAGYGYNTYNYPGPYYGTSQYGGYNY